MYLYFNENITSKIRQYLSTNFEKPSLKKIANFEYALLAPNASNTVLSNTYKAYRNNIDKED